jgi:peptidylprolyl isomerase
MRPATLVVCVSGLWGVLALAGCGGAPQSEPRTAMSKAEVARLGEPHIVNPRGPAPTHLAVKDLKKGWGPAAKVSDELAVEFAAAPYGVKAPRWRSGGRLEPFVLHLGAYDVVPGWEKGLAGMRVGGRRELVVPARLAGRGGARVYVVDLLSVQRGQPPVLGASDGPQEAGKPNVEAAATPPPQELIVDDLHNGSGPTLHSPDEAVVKLYGVNYETGESFLNAWGPDGTATLSLRNPHSIWTEGLDGMKVGGRRKLVVPARLAFGGPAFVFVAELSSIIS